ncbi:MAG: PEP-CTERM sorting domain-containing protein, partial [Planctomycetota bacterium]
FIPAGREILFGYRMKVDADGSTGAFATGDGHITFTITPEPTAASLLALGAVTLFRRRRG